MYRKVHNTLLAFSASGVLLLVGLMAGTPVTPAPEPTVRLVQVGPLVLRVTAAVGESPTDQPLPAAAFDDAELTPMQVLSHGARLAAAVAVQNALLAEADQAEAADSTVDADRADVQRRHVRRAREALALPYFSFAQGLRRNRS